MKQSKDTSSPASLSVAAVNRLVGGQADGFPSILIKGGILVNEGTQRKADIIIRNGLIEKIMDEGSTYDCASFDVVIDAEDCLVMPGVIDTHVHFREPGFTHKASMETESRAAAYGGVTSVFDMPNTKPQTTNIAGLNEKKKLAERNMHVNYSFFIGATNDNIAELRQVDVAAIPGIKLFMGSSTGNMLVDKEEALDAVFAVAKEKGLVLMAHCEDTDIINRNMQCVKDEEHTDDPDVTKHPLIRSEEACYKSSELAVRLARKYGTALHIAHVSTAKELSLLDDADSNITFEATVAHLLFSQQDYETLGTRIKCNPAIKTVADRQALRRALSLRTGGVSTIGTDHAPHTLEEKKGGAAKAMSGMPMIQFSLVSMLSLVDQGVLTVEQMVRLMSHNPAELFSIERRGFLRVGYVADIAIVRRDDVPWIVTKDCIQSKCGWSPLEGRQFHWRVRQTICNGRIIYDNGRFRTESRGMELMFCRA